MQSASLFPSVSAACRVLMFFFLAHSQLAEQYGSEVAADILARSQASAHLDFSPPTSSIAGTGATYMSSHGRYDSLAAKAPGGIL